MSGSDQSVNLGGMLSQIGSTLGTQGDTYRQQLSQNIVNISRPELDLNDPDSMEKYMKWAVGTGTMSEGQATQMAWQVQKLREGQKAEAEASRSRGLVTSYRDLEGKLGALQANLGKAQNAGNVDAAAALSQQVQGYTVALDNMKAAIANDPMAAEAKYNEDTRMYTVKQREAKAAKEQAAALLLQQEQEFKAMSNNITGAFVSGVVDVETEQGQKMLTKMKQAAPELYEDVITRVTTFKEKEDKMYKATGNLGTTELQEEDFAEFADPARAYEAYKKNFAISPKSANHQVTAQYGLILKDSVTRGADKPEETTKWTKSMHDLANPMAEGTVLELVYDAYKTLAAAENGLEEADVWFPNADQEKTYTAAEAKRNEAAASFLLELEGDSDEAKTRREALAAEAIASLAATGVSPTPENVREAVIKAASRKGASFTAMANSTNTNVDTRTERDFESEYE